jgi:hypothetical protein
MIEHDDDVCIISSLPVAERWKGEVRWQEERAIFHIIDVDMPQHSEEYIQMWKVTAIESETCR